jgi:hypothetical protein
MSKRRRSDEESSARAHPKGLTKAQPKDFSDPISFSSPTVSVISFGERLLAKHLALGCFQSGVEKGLWRVVDIRWPCAAFALMTDGTGGRFREATIRLHLERYPIEPPLLELWNARRCSAVDADLWPRWYVNFVSESFPHLVGVPITPFKPEVLNISAVIARRLRSAANYEAWDQAGDITQVLIGLLICFRRLDTNDISVQDSFPDTSIYESEKRY